MRTAVIVEGYTFHGHYKIKDIARLFTPETVKELVLLLHRKRRRFFGMKRAQCHIAGPLLLQLDVRTQHINDVKLILDPPDKVPVLIHSPLVSAR